MEIQEENRIVELIYEEAVQQEKRISEVLGKVEDEELSDELNHLLAEWRLFGNKAKRRLQENHSQDLDTDVARTEIMRTEKMAERMKYMIHENKQAGIFATELAKELIDFEETSIRKLKNYL